MKKFIFLSLLLIILGAASAKAQVSIGTVNDPHAAAILDLQSNAKGLLLPHVALDDLEILQVGGSKADEDLTATGMIVYNISPNFCEGVYFWNGSQWRKAGKDYQVKTTGSGGLTITSVPSNEWDAIVAGENVTFKLTAPGDAQFYKWYLDNTYLATTTSPEYTSYFSLGNHKMKVELDNCLSLAESNSVSFSTQNVYPTSMPATGDEDRWIRIYNGNDASPFPYAATSEYVSTGLVAHYDGIDNTGDGDKAHDFNASSWQDLKNSSFSIPRGPGAGQWLSNGFQALDALRSFASTSIPAAYPVGNSSRTIEVIFRTPDADKMFVQALDNRIILFYYGWPTYMTPESAGKIFGVMYRGRQIASCGTNNQWVFYPIVGNQHNYATCLSSTPSLEAPNTINTVTSTYANSLTDSQTAGYINNIYSPPIHIDGTHLSTAATGIVYIGENFSHATLLSLRLYDRVLTAAEIQRNADLDQKRYLAPPQVWIGSQQCENVTVLSPRALTCKVPANNGQSGKLAIEVKNADGSNPPILTYTDQFEYIAP
jgi:hypothetical protein